MSRGLKEAASEIRSMAGKRARRESPPLERFRVERKSPLFLRSYVSDLTLDEGDFDFEISRGFRGLVSVGDDVWVGTDSDGDRVIVTLAGDGDDPTSGGSVDSVFGRKGVVIAESGDYEVSQVTGAAAEADLMAEEAARIAEDEAEASARAVAVAEEASARATAISAEEAARKSADSTEKSSRESADTAIKGEVATEKSSRESADASEKSARETADGERTKGPGSATSGDFATFSGTTGKVLQDPGWSRTTDGTLAGNSDSLIPSEKAVKTYVDALLAASDAVLFKGSIDCSANPKYPKADAGHEYMVSVAGKIGGASGIEVEAGDMIICKTDGTAEGTQAEVGTKWGVIQTNIVGAVTGPASSTEGHIPQFSDASGKVLKDGLALDTDNTLAANSDAKVPTQKAVKGYVETQAGLLVPKSTVTTKGDLIVATGSSALTRLGIGSTGKVLTVSGGTAAWEANAAITALEANGVGVVYHGSEAGKARPTGFACVIWIGSVEPEKSLATDVWLPENTSNSFIDWGLVTSLPASPNKGDYCSYYADETNGIVWHLIYDGKGEYPWKKIGGMPLRAQDLGGTRKTKSTTAQTTGAPSITAPLKMEFRARYGVNYALLGTAAVTEVAHCQLFVNGTLKALAVLTTNFQFGGGPMDVAGVPLGYAVAAGQAISTRYKVENGVGEFEWHELFVEADPIRVG